MRKATRYFYIAAAAGIVLLFAYISYLTPLAGDDWGHAIAGASGNPFVLAYDTYFSWSGRFFSELFNYIVAPNKGLWNILNPLIFLGIFLCLCHIVEVRKHPVLIPLLFVFLMLSVKDYVRMETYTWLSGTTFTISLLSALAYTWILKNKIFKTWDGKVATFFMTLLVFHVSLAMENIAAALLVGNILVMIYCHYFKRWQFWHLFWPTLFSIIGFVLLRVSPGAGIRLTEHPEWLDYNLFEQIAINWQNLIRYSFTDNKFLYFCLSILALATAIQKREDLKKPVFWILSIVFSLTLLASFAQSIHSYIKVDFLTLFYDLSTAAGLIVCSVLVIVFAVALAILLYSLFDYEEFWVPFYCLLIALGSNAVMLLSPIFGARSSLYTIYFLMVPAGYLLRSLKIKLPYRLAVTVVLAVLIAVELKEYWVKYRAVAAVQKIRDQEIAYYKDHPEETEIWILRMPIYTIHSGDIEEGDSYHEETFLLYYGLNPEATIHMYIPEDRP
jgi:hypothetical protein